MAGHSQFKNIMYRKGAQDARRAGRFAKIIREITVSAKKGIPDVESNPRLRAAVQTARQANMPKDTIERAIRKAIGTVGVDNYEEVRYEGYGPAGTALIVEALTDNRNRTTSEVRTAFNKYGGSLGENNSVNFMFSRTGVIFYQKEVANEESVLEAAIEAGADNVESSEEGHEILTSPESFFAIKELLEQKFKQVPERAKMEWRPNTRVFLNEESTVTVLKLISALEESDDVQNVWANFDTSEEILARL